MAKIYGRTALPLPPSLVTGLDSLGFVRIGEDTPAQYRVPRHPQLRLELVASNVPGDTAVIVTGLGEPARRREADAVLVEAAIAITKADDPNQRRSI